MKRQIYECSLCGRIWTRLTLRMEQGKTCNTKCASIKGYLGGDRKETGIELKLQEILTELGIEYTTQKPLLGVTVADIFIEPNVAVFADGTYWHSGAAKEYKDAEKTKTLKRGGYVVLRLEEKEINKDVDKIKLKLLEAYGKRRIKKEL